MAVSSISQLSMPALPDTSVTPKAVVSDKPGRPPVAMQSMRLSPTLIGVLPTYKPKHQPHQLKTALILGSGPTGLAAALTLQRMGIQVTLVDRRDPSQSTLPPNLNLRMGTLDRLTDLDVYESMRDSLATLDFVESHRNDGEVVMRFPAGPRTPDGDRAGFDPKGLLAKPPVAMARSSQLVRALYEHTQQRGIKAMPFCEADLSPTFVPGESGKAPRLRYGAQVASKSGERVDFGVPDLIIVAEGANSSTREKLGIPVTVDPRQGEFIGGSFKWAEAGPNNGAFTHTYAIKDGGSFLRGLALTNPAGGNTWTVVQVPPERSADLKPGAETRELFRAEARRALGDAADTLDIEWGGEQAFKVKVQMAERVTAGDNVVFLGDAARSGSFFAAAGLNLGMVSDIQALISLINTGREGTLSWSDALRLYELRVKKASRAWVEASEEFIRG